MDTLITSVSITTLSKFGLTRNQARVYLALVCAGTSDAKTISKESGITRQDIYRILPSLEQKGLVEKEFSKPSCFRAIPIQETLQTLLEQRGKETLSLRKNIRVIIENFSEKKANKKSQNNNLETIYIPGKNALLKKVEKSIINAKISMQCISSWGNMTKHMFEVFGTDLFKEKKKSQIKIQIITDGNDNEKSLLPVVTNPNFTFRSIHIPAKAHFLIIDKKEVFFKISTKGFFSEIPSLWSINSSLVAICLNYFETLWNKSL